MAMLRRLKPGTGIEGIEGIEADDLLTEEARTAKLDALGRALSETRKEAINGRLVSGIEKEWTEDEEAYNGIDDANRGEYRSHYSKGDPLGTTSRELRDKSDTRSTVLPNITRPYVDAAAARLADMLLPVDEQPFAIKPTPIPELAKIVESQDMTPVIVDGQGGPVETTKSDYARAIMDEANERAENAQTQIDDWLQECRWPHEVRSVIEDAARIGTGVLKGPEPVKKRNVMWLKDPGGYDIMEVKQEIQPASRCVSVWDCFPDPSCGECIHDGNYHWERDYLSRKQLAALKDSPGYINSQIDACLLEGPQALEPYWLDGTAGIPQPHKDLNKYQVWYYYGEVKKEDYIAAQPVETDGDGSPTIGDSLYSQFSNLPDSVCIVATVVNHRIVRLKQNPLDTGEFPYDYMIWSKRPGIPYGSGISRQIRTPQKMLSASTRNMMDNAALGGGPIVILDPYSIEPAGDTDDWALRSRKVFLKREGVSMADARNAIVDITVDIVVEKLMQIVQFALRMAEEVTGLPMILQGQMGEKNNTDRVGVAQILNNNGSTVLRRLAKLFDDRITKPHIVRYYRWLMLRGEDQNYKGDFEVVAQGSSTLVEREIQNQELIQLLPLALNPIYGLDPEKVITEYLRSRHFDPARFELDEQKKAQLRQQQDPIALAEVAIKNAEAALKAAQAKKIAAETIKVGVETQYTGIQTGQTIVAIPEVAPVTDTIIRNAADGLDANDKLPVQAGAVPPVISAEPLFNRRTGIRVQQNTSPALPPVAPSPEEGIGAGIETQRDDGVRR